MPTSGSYEFKLSPKAIGGLVEDELGMFPGEWAWHKQDVNGTPFLAIYCCCPDCGLLITVWRRFGVIDVHGHKVDGAGDISPSLLHSYVVQGVQKCGFHTQPTKLLDFVDLR